MTLRDWAMFAFGFGAASLLRHCVAMLRQAWCREVTTAARSQIIEDEKTGSLRGAGYLVRAKRTDQQKYTGE
jgi:hypothetical protein